MTNQNLIKLLIKIDSGDTNKWVHLCYIPEKICNSYKEKYPDYASDLRGTIARWSKEDFGKEIIVETAEDLETLKGAVKEFCKEAYSDIYLEQVTDRQGWMRVWITRKMKEDLSNNGK
jgi:hypothetical protein